MKQLFWIRFLAALMLLVGAAGCIDTAAMSKTPPVYVQELENKTVALVFQVGRGQVKPYCTGVWVGSNVILTAKHCVDGVVRYLNSKKEMEEEQEKAVGLKVHYVVGKEVEGLGVEPSAIHLGTCLAISEEYDLALIRAEGRMIPEHQYAELADISPAVGSKVRVMGHPGAIYYTYVEGVVSAYREDLPGMDKRKGPYVQVSAPIWFGNSGGGLFDLDGKLVGIASFMATGPNATFFIHINNVRKFLVANKVL